MAETIEVTAAGRGVIAAGAALLALAYWFGYPAPAVIGLAGLGSVVVAGLAIAGTLDDSAELRLASAVNVVRGETIEVDVVLRRRGGNRFRALRPALSVGAGLSVRGAVKGTDGAVRFSVLAQSRGVGVIGPVTVVRTDPLGLVTRRREMSGTVSVLVRPVTRILPGAAFRGGGGGTAVRGTTLREGIAFDSLREYSEDDDIRQVHWLASLRTGDDSLLVRVTRDPAEPRDLLVLDTAADAYGSGLAAAHRFETAVDVAASVGVSFAAVRRPFGFATSGGRVSASRGGRGDALRFLDLLARIPMEDAPNRYRRSVSPAADRATRRSVRLAKVLATARRSGAARLVIVTGTAPDADSDAAIGAATVWCPRVVVLRVGEPVDGVRQTTDAATANRRRRSRAAEVVVRSLDDLAAAWPLSADVGRGSRSASPVGRR